MQIVVIALYGFAGRERRLIRAAPIRRICAGCQASHSLDELKPLMVVEITIVLTIEVAVWSGSGANSFRGFFGVTER
jgi:hypothetical protein